jgi:hypothetical protein
MSFVNGEDKEPVVITMEEVTNSKNAKTIIRTKEVCVIVIKYSLFLQEDQLITLPPKFSLDEKRQVFQIMCPEYNLSILKHLPTNPTTTSQLSTSIQVEILMLVSIDRLGLGAQTSHKFGVIYCGPGQTKESEMYFNGPNFPNFITISRPRK